MSTALNNAGHNCNIVTQAESMVMAKERLVEQYGEIRYTIGTGCSGGSLTQQQVANAYPGIYQGILPACSFPDAWSTGQQLVDYHLVRRYAENPAKWGTGVAWDPASIAAVEGHPNHVNSIVFDTVYWTSLGVPDDGCPGVPAEDNYNAETNPGGVRCTLADYMINVFGPRPASVWIARRAGRSATASPGCRSTTSGSSTGSRRSRRARSRPAQFVDLNDEDRRRRHRHQPDPRALRGRPARARATPTAAAASTAPTTSTEVAIIDLRGPDPGAFHDAYRSWAIRARLEREHGTFANQVIWFGAVPLMGDPNYADRGNARDGPVARGGRGRPAAPARWRRRSSATARATSTTAARRSTGSSRSSLPGVGPVCELKEVADPVRHAAHGRRRGRRDRHEQVHAEAAAAPRLLPDHVHRRPVGAPAAGVPDRRLRLERAGRRARRTRSRGRPTRTRAATSSTAAGRSAPRPAGRAAAGPARRSRHGAADDLRARPGGGRIPHRRRARRARLRPGRGGAELLQDRGAPDDLQHAGVPGCCCAR